MSVAPARALTPRERLRAHLLTHADAEMADFWVWWLLDQFPPQAPRLKGEKKPHPLDADIYRSQKKIEDHHTGGAKLTDYWAEVGRGVRLQELRERTRERGAPRSTEPLRALAVCLNKLYPSDFPRKSRGKHFQTTFRLACVMVGIKLPQANARKNRTEVDIVHEIVVDALAGIDPPQETPTDVKVARHAYQRRLPPAR